MSERREVVVVGGGPAGSAAAIALAGQGHDVLLLEAARFPRDKICGDSVSPGAWPLLEQLGAAGAVRALEPQPLRGMVLTSPDGTRFCGHYGSARAPGFALRRAVLDHALLECARAAGAEVREGARVARVVTRAGAVAGVELADGTRVEARVCVAADGRQGVVARQLGLLAPHPRLRRFAVRGYWDGVLGLGEHGEMHVAAGAYCGVAPLSDRHANVTFVLDRAQMTAAAGDLPGFYLRTLGRWPRLRERLSGARLLEPPRAIGPLALVARRVSGPGVLLVGDAAGFFDPFTGEGVTLALRCALLAAEVAHAALAGSHADLARYDALRQRATRDKFLFNRLVQHAVAWPALADALAHRLARQPALADRLVRIAGDLAPARSALALPFAAELLRG